MATNRVRYKQKQKMTNLSEVFTGPELKPIQPSNALGGKPEPNQLPNEECPPEEELPDIGYPPNPLYEI